jgi:integrase
MCLYINELSYNELVVLVTTFKILAYYMLIRRFFMKVRITKKWLDDIEHLGVKAQDIYWDEKREGFGVIVGKGKPGKPSKSFVVQTRSKVDNSTTRVTLGRYSTAFTLKMAEDAVDEIFSGLRNGAKPAVDRKEAAKQSKIKGLTFRQAFEEYVAVKSLKPSTVKNYTNVLEDLHARWMDRPWQEFTKEDARAIYDSVAFSKSNPRPGYANLWARTVRPVLNRTAREYDVSGYVNPVAFGLQDRMVELKPRKGNIKPQYFKAFFAAINMLKNQDFADFYRFVMLSGVRNYEALSLPWSNVDLYAKSYMLYDTKNGTDVELPLSDYMTQMLWHRYKNRTNHFVFPGTGKTGHLVEPKKVTATLVDNFNAQLSAMKAKLKDQGEMVQDHENVGFIVHDLRRTFLNLSIELEVDPFTYKALVNHREKATDVTARYVNPPLPVLRAAHTRINDYILHHAGIQ